MKLWRWLAIGGLALGVVGAYLVYQVTNQLLKASSTYDGIRDRDWSAEKFRNRLGWVLVGAGFVAQAVSVYLAGD
jgi:hypothetical protein